MPIQPDVEFYAHLAAGRLMLPADKKGTPFYPPRAVVPGDGSEDIQWIEFSGRGVVYSSTTVFRKPPEANYNVSLVDLTEGPRMMSRVEGIAAEEVKIGMPVAAKIITPEQGPAYIIFVPEFQQ